MFQQLPPPTGDPPSTAPDDDEADRVVADLLASPPIRAAGRAIHASDERTLSDQIELTGIPAPPFGEGARAARMRDLFEEAGLAKVEIDAAGNVLGHREPGPRPLVLSAHLDTVFPASTDLTVERKGDTISAPGISDDGRGLAVLLAVARALREGDVRLGTPLLFVATVGEEGAGDLRGVRHLFGEDGAARDARAFVSIDGAGAARLVTRGLGSRRYRVRARGPGGHSWIDWGAPNPIHLLGRVVAGVTALELPSTPATSLTVSRWHGGTSVNAIPAEAWVEMEIRSESAAEIDRLDREVRELAARALDTENRAGVGYAEASLSVEVIGDRPTGETDPSDPLVRAAVAATRAVGFRPELASSSTDSNVAMSLGIPSVTIGGGGEAGGAHTTGEWYRNEKGPEGVLRVLLTLVAYERLEG